ncbi:MAG: phosphoribosylformylglycinamidine cyclo-ligase [Candidatus Bathyarchaeia archaeon]|nr:phosphoribosylformylglycinamidine cyclo-ligase [Candidatus Bathyarchaeota archaeon]
MPEEFTYARAGVDRTLRATSKKALVFLEDTYRFSRYGEILRLPYGNLIPYRGDYYLDLVIEGIGTKVLVAQLAEKYDTIGIDGVAMAVNDVIRSGARPLAIADNIHAQVSDPYLVQEWMKGIVKGAVEAECVVPSGEIGDVAEVIRGIIEGKGFDMVFAAVGEVSRDRVITARDVQPGDVIIGMRSSGIHSNGITLARRILFKRWGGLYEPYDVPEPLDRELIYEVLEPTRIYVKPLMRVADVVKVKAAVHITGDAYLKFERISKFSKGVGFIFDNFEPQPIFAIIQDAAVKLGSRISDEEMFKTFNMGWGFAIVVDRMDKDAAIDAVERTGIKAEEIGRITDNPGIEIHYRGRKFILG